MKLIPCFNHYELRWTAQKGFPIPREKPAALAWDDQRLPAGHRGVIVAGAKRGHSGVLQSERATPGVHLRGSNIPRNFADDKRRAATEVACKTGSQIVDARLIVIGREGRAVEKDDRLPVDHGPVFWR